jgi:N-acyl-D-amino-acid deacylase
MQPESLFRIASVTKALTALAVMKLVEQHKLGLGDSVFSLLPYNKLPHEHRDPRLGNITVQQLLESTAGWNRQRGGDPLFAPYICEAADQYSNSLRPQPDAIARMWLEHDLDFDPGTHFNYSNFSYLLLGRLVEQVSGQRFAAFVHQAVLVPAEATGMQPGRTCARCANEVVHYPFAQQESGASVFPNYKGMVPLTYGGNFSLEAMVADTGWLSSAPDLVRLFSAVFDRHAVVSPATLEMMLARPQVPEWRNAPEYFGMGFEVVAPGKHPRIEYRQGSLPGTTAVVAHRDDGWTWCFLLNTRPADGYSCQMEFTRLLWATVNAFPRHFHNS